MIDLFELPVFPAADVFPMMADDELQELAADIAENGLREPLVVAEIDDEDMLIDGRNRRAACKIAEVKPTTKRLNGEDPTAYVLSANIHRRHMTKGQRAIAVAMIYPDSEQGKRGTSVKTTEVRISSASLSHARTILRYAGDLADSVLTGSMSFDEAYRTARQRKQEAESCETQLAELRARNPELADKVVECELTLAGAQAEANARDEQARTQRANLFSHLAKIVYTADTIGSADNIESACKTLLAYPAEFETQERYTVDRLLEACATVQESLPKLIQKIKEARDEVRQ